MAHFPIPVKRVLRKLGQDINDARRRRRITIELMAQRANLSRSTIAKIERGDPTTSMGGYTTVLFILGMEKRVGDLVDSANDFIGRRLEDERLPQRVRYSRRKTGDDNEQQ